MLSTSIILQRLAFNTYHRPPLPFPSPKFSLMTSHDSLNPQWNFLLFFRKYIFFLMFRIKRDLYFPLRVLVNFLGLTSFFSKLIFFFFLMILELQQLTSLMNLICFPVIFMHSLIHLLILGIKKFDLVSAHNLTSLLSILIAL